MKRDSRPDTVRPLFEMGTEIPSQPESEQDIGDRKGEARRIVKRLAAIVEDHRQAAIPLGVDLGGRELFSSSPLYVSMLRAFRVARSRVPVMRYMAIASTDFSMNLWKNQVIFFLRPKRALTQSATMQ